MKRRAGGEAELLRDVVLDARRRGGGERDDGRGPQQRQPLAEQPVVGPEVVAPLRDAVRLVDRDERRRAPGQHLGEAGHPQPLGGDEEEVEPPVEVVAADLRARRPGRARSGCARPRRPSACELRDLVLHERDQGRDDEGRAAAREAGELVAERLPRARRHDEQHVLALDHRAGRPPPGTAGRRARPEAARGGSVGERSRRTSDRALRDARRCDGRWNRRALRRRRHDREPTSRTPAGVSRV